MTLRQALIALNVIAALAIVVILVAWVLLAGREKGPQNLTPALPDEELETRKLERVLGASLVFTVAIAAGLSLYWLFEPTRQADATGGFESRSIERGEILYSNKQMKAYDSTRSLLCADCHGSDAGGGTAPFVLASEDPTCKPGDTTDACLPTKVTWKAPALNTVFYRFPRPKGTPGKTGPDDCTGLQKIDPTNSDCYTQVTDIITYGRPGTPMPPWGVASGKGVLNEQGISDLVNYLESIQLSPEKAKQQIQDNVDALKKQAGDGLANATKNLTDAQAALAKATSFKDKAALQSKVDAATTALQNATAFETKISKADDGELLFLTNCARCHTKGWSFVAPDDPTIGLPAPDGSGAFGPNLAGGATTRQFPDPADQSAFITQGSKKDQGYGLRGIGSGRMPGFANLLTPQQIDDIVAYERSL